MEGEFLKLMFWHAVKQDLPAVYRAFIFEREMGEDWLMESVGKYMTRRSQVGQGHLLGHLLTTLR
jgi:hypothetical protein